MNKTRREQAANSNQIIFEALATAEKEFEAYVALTEPIRISKECEEHNPGAVNKSWDTPLTIVFS